MTAGSTRKAIFLEPNPRTTNSYLLPKDLCAAPRRHNSSMLMSERQAAAVSISSLPRTRLETRTLSENRACALTLCNSVSQRLHSYLRPVLANSIPVTLLLHAACARFRQNRVHEAPPTVRQIPEGSARQDRDRTNPTRIESLPISGRASSLWARRWSE